MADTDVDEIASESAPLFVRDEGFFSPVRRYYRFTGLFFICFITFGGEFSYVLPGALEKYFERDLGINTTQFTLFNSLYSWPSVVICIFGGILIDKVLGIRLGGIILSSFITLGNFLFAFGAYFNNVLVMDIGRFIFGMGGESVGIGKHKLNSNLVYNKQRQLIASGINYLISVMNESILIRITFSSSYYKIYLNK